MQSICVVATMNQHLKVVVLLLKLYSLFIVAPVVGVLCLFHVLLCCALCPFHQYGRELVATLFAFLVS